MTTPQPIPPAPEDPVLRAIRALAAFATAAAESLERARPTSRLAAFFPVAMILNGIARRRVRRARTWANCLAAMLGGLTPPPAASNPNPEEDDELSPELPLAPRLVFRLPGPLAPTTPRPSPSQMPAPPRLTPDRHTSPLAAPHHRPTSRRLLPPPRAAPAPA